MWRESRNGSLRDGLAVGSSELPERVILSLGWENGAN